MDNTQEVASLDGLRQHAGTLFEQRFGDAPTMVVCAPGRVNLIGEHTDYNDGFVFPAAIDRYVVVAVASSPDASKVWSEGYPEPAVFETEAESSMHGWTRFPAGSAWTLGRHGAKPSNINAVVVSDLPTGAGVSSSAAIELAFLTAWNQIDSLNKEPKTLALLGQECEHDFIGVHCGVMDQLAVALGRESHAMLIDTRSLEVEYHPIPPGLEIVLCDTGLERSLAGSAYNDRRRECEEAAAGIGVDSLRDAGLSDLEGTNLRSGTVQFKRARHVLTENERCLGFSRALEAGDLGMVGKMLQESHESLRDDYEVSCQELDWMAEAAWAAEGCVGARMTGAGFGGACVALVESSKLSRFIESTKNGFMRRSPGLEPRFFACHAADGARVI